VRSTDSSRGERIFDILEKSEAACTTHMKPIYLSTYEHLELPSVASNDFLIFKREKKQYFKWERTILDFPNVAEVEKMSVLPERYEVDRR